MGDPKAIPFGKYLLLDKIAEGAIAQLYRAQGSDVRNPERPLSIKIIHPRLSRERDLANTFIEEAKLASLLNHQNIVRVYDVGRVEGFSFIAMEYLLGKNLRCIFDRSQEKGMPLSLENALYIVSRICCGLDYAHKLTDSQGKPLHIIHRDINPQNVLVTYEGEVKIVDFGIVRAGGKSAVTKHEMLKKKVTYMSPEQVLGERIDWQSDIFSTGILLYELATNKRMYTGEPLQIMAKVRKAEFEPAEVVMTGLPPKFYAILNKALAKEKVKRYQSCGEMLAEIEECLSELSVRPTSQKLAEYMIGLFGEEIDPEGRILSNPAKAESALVVSAPTNPAPEVAKPAVPEPGVHTPVDSNGLVPGQVSFNPAVSGPGSGEPETVLGMDLQLGEDGSKKEKTKTEGEGDFKPRNRGVCYAALMTALAVFVLGWAFWPKEEPVSTAARAEAKALRDKAAGVAEKNPLEAESLLLKALELEPTNVQGHFQMGLTYMALKNSPKAVEAYQKAIELDPKFPEAYFNLGYIFGMNKDYSKAEQMYSQVVKLAPSYLDEALYNLSLVQEKQGKRGQSIENLKRALQINPKNEMAQKLLKKTKGTS